MDANDGKRISERVIGCAYEVLNTLGSRFLQSVYQKALCLELEYQRIRFESQKSFPVSYRGIAVGYYVSDLVVDDKLLVELKAVSALTPEHEAQVLNYLRASHLPVGILLNFGSPRLGIRRIVSGYDEASVV